VALVALGHEVVACSRRRPEIPGAEVRSVDVADVAAPLDALSGCSATYYLVHSLSAGDFRARDRHLAEGFGRGARRAGVGRIVYLGGLGLEPASERLSSRQEVGAALASGGVPVLELRAASGLPGGCERCSVGSSGNDGPFDARLR
jgi:uncharacterized protein YbjT (DUF2867 family)